MFNGLDSHMTVAEGCSKLLGRNKDRNQVQAWPLAESRGSPFGSNLRPSQTLDPPGQSDACFLKMWSIIPISYSMNNFIGLNDGIAPFASSVIDHYLTLLSEENALFL